MGIRIFESLLYIIYILHIDGRKSDIDDSRLFHQLNKQSVKVMVSACITWNGVTKPFFVTGKGLKVNEVNIWKKSFYLTLTSRSKKGLGIFTR